MFLSCIVVGLEIPVVVIGSRIELLPCCTAQWPPRRHLHPEELLRRTWGERNGLELAFPFVLSGSILITGVIMRVNSDP